MSLADAERRCDAIPQHDESLVQMVVRIREELLILAQAKQDKIGTLVPIGPSDSVGQVLNLNLLNLASKIIYCASYGNSESDHN